MTQEEQREQEAARAPVFDLVCDVIDLSGEFAHFTSRLLVCCPVDRVEDDVLEVRVNRVLMRLDDLFENLVLFASSALLDLSLPALFRLTNTPLSLGEHAEGVDAALLLQTDELLAEEVESVADAFTLQLRQDLVDEVLLQQSAMPWNAPCWV